MCISLKLRYLYSNESSIKVWVLGVKDSTENVSNYVEQIHLPYLAAILKNISTTRMYINVYISGIKRPTVMNQVSNYRFGGQEFGRKHFLVRIGLLHLAYSAAILKNMSAAHIYKCVYL